MDTNTIIQNMKAQLKGVANKQEGSFASDVLQSAGMEIGRFYSYSDILFKNHFIGSAEGEFLDQKAEDYGISRKPANKSTGTLELTGTAGTEVPQGSIFYSDTAQFESVAPVTLTSGTVDVNIICTVEGVGGNVPSGAINQTDITGVSSVTNPNPLTNGAEEETDVAFKSRILAKIRTPATSGNKHHYRNWALEVSGVGAARVVPLHAGAGTVKVLILNSQMDIAGSELVDAVKDYIGPDQNGEGKAPIGATLTVESGVAKTINVSVDVDIEGYSLSEVQDEIESNLISHFKEISFNNNYQGVSYARISDLIFNSKGVKDFQNLKINNGVVNIPLNTEEFPKLGTLGVT